MPNIDYGKVFDGIKDTILSTVREDAQAFLDRNQDAVKFLEEQARDLAQLGVDYAAASDDERKSVLFEMKLVEQTVKNKLAGIAVQEEAQARADFERILRGVLSTAIKLLPVVLSAI